MHGPLAELDVPLLLAFGFGSVIAVCAVVVLSGFLPRRDGPAAGAGVLGAALIVFAVLALLALLGALVLTAPRLPLAVAVIAAGLAVLGGPFLVQSFPRQLRDSRLILAAAILLPVAAVAALPLPI